MRGITKGCSEIATTTDTTAVTTDTLTTTSSFLTYENPAFNIKLDYPSDWQAWSGNDTFDPSGLANVATFFSPEDDDYASFVLYVEDLSVSGTSKNLDDYLDASINMYKDTYSGFKLNSSDTDQTIAGSSAYSLTGMYDDSSRGKLNMGDTGTISGDLAYSIQYSASPVKYAQYLPTIEKMINSLELTGETAE